MLGLHIRSAKSLQPVHVTKHVMLAEEPQTIVVLVSRSASHPLPLSMAIVQPHPANAPILHFQLIHTAQALLPQSSS